MLTLFSKIRKIDSFLMERTESISHVHDGNGDPGRLDGHQRSPGRCDTPGEILEWAVERFYPRLTMATAFGAEGCVLLHLLAEIEPRVRVFNLDTGYQFAETLELRDRIAAAIRDRGRAGSCRTRRWRSTRSSTTGPLYVIKFRTSAAMIGKSYRCGERWLDTTPGSRRSVPTSRRTGRALKVVGGDPKFGLVKINPLLELDPA